MLDKNSKEINERVRKIEEESLREEIIREIVIEDLKEYDRNILEERIKDSLGNIDLSSLNEKEFYEKLVEAYTKLLPFGYCHIYWGKKKYLLKQKHNIDWFTPQEENPSVDFD